jgi:hypothetical protein
MGGPSIERAGKISLNQDLLDGVGRKLRALDVRFRLPVLVEYSPHVERSLTLSIEELYLPLQTYLPSIDDEMKTAISTLSRLEVARLLLAQWRSFGPIAPYAGNVVALLRYHAEEFGPYVDVRQQVPRGESLVVYRGADESEMTNGLGFGASWTLDREIATAFARQNWYRANVPTVFRGRVSKDAILGFIFERRKREVILDPDYVRQVKPLSHLGPSRMEKLRVA